MTVERELRWPKLLTSGKKSSSFGSQTRPCRRSCRRHGWSWHLRIMWGTKLCMGLAYGTEETTKKIASWNQGRILSSISRETTLCSFRASQSQIDAQLGSPACDWVSYQAIFPNTKFWGVHLGLKIVDCTHQALARRRSYYTFSGKRDLWLTLSHG